MPIVARNKQLRGVLDVTLVHASKSSFMHFLVLLKDFHECLGRLFFSNM